jgi:RecA/RadA recombinase
MASKKKAAKKQEKKEKRLNDDELKIPQISGESIAPAADGPQGQTLKKMVREFIAHENSRADTDNKGHKVIAFASEVPNTYELRRPCGIMQLDLDTGGGLPAGGLSYVSGPDNAGKTFLIMLYMLMHQKLYGPQSSLAYACVEGGFDFKRAIKMGLRVSVPDKIIEQWDMERRQRGFAGYTKEEWSSFKQELGEFVLIGGNTGEEILQTTLNAIQTRLFGIVAVDSVSIILPEADADKDLDENNKRAANASLVTDFIKHYTPMTSGLDGLNYTTLIFSAQVRSNQERANANPAVQKYIKQWATTGAYAGRHGKLVDICVWSGEKIHQTVSKERVTIGKETKYEIMKGKAGAHDNVQGAFNFYYDMVRPDGVDQIDSIIVAGLKAGVIQESNGKINVVRPETRELTEIRDIPGFAAFKRMMEIDFAFELYVRREVLAAKGIMCLYR